MNPSAITQSDSRFQATNNVKCTFNGCYYVTTSKKKLNEHKTYNEDHDYCAKCDLDFPDCDSFKEHKVTTRCTITCKYCGKDFHTKFGRNAHIDQAHPMKCEIKCPSQHCAEEFTKACHFVSHLERGDCPGISKDQFASLIRYKFVEKALKEEAIDEEGRQMKLRKRVAERASSLQLQDHGPAFPTLGAAHGSNGSDLRVPVGALAVAKAGGFVNSLIQRTTQLRIEEVSDNRSDATEPARQPASFTIPGEDTGINHRYQKIRIHQSNVVDWKAAERTSPKSDEGELLESHSWEYAMVKKTPQRKIDTVVNGDALLWNADNHRYDADFFWVEELEGYVCPFKYCDKEFYPTEFLDEENHTSSNLRRAATKALENHINLAHTDYRILCPLCLKHFPKHATLISHIENVRVKCKIRHVKDLTEVVDFWTGGFIKAVLSTRLDIDVKVEEDRIACLRYEAVLPPALKEKPKVKTLGYQVQSSSC